MPVEWAAQPHPGLPASIELRPESLIGRKRQSRVNANFTLFRDSALTMLVPVKIDMEQHQFFTRLNQREIAYSKKWPCRNFHNIHDELFIF